MKKYTKQSRKFNSTNIFLCTHGIVGCSILVMVDIMGGIYWSGLSISDKAFDDEYEDINAAIDYILGYPAADVYEFTSDKDLAKNLPKLVEEQIKKQKAATLINSKKG